VDNPGASVDRTVLDRLEQGVGRDMVGALVGEFLQIVDDRLTLIEVAGSSADLGTLIRQAHDLGTEAGSLGLTALFAAARDLETAGRRGDTARAVAIAQEIRAIAGPALAAIKALFPGS